MQLFRTEIKIDLKATVLRLNDQTAFFLTFSMRSDWELFSFLKGANIISTRF